METIQIGRALTRPVYGWKSHPAVLMWQGFEEALGCYGLAMVDAWLALGREDTCAATIIGDLDRAGVQRPRSQAELRAAGALPAWLGDEAFHLAHRSNLLRKDPAWYGPRFGDVPADLPYVWPVRSADRRR